MGLFERHRQQNQSASILKRSAVLLTSGERTIHSLLRWISLNFKKQFRVVRQSEDGTAYRWFLLWARSLLFLCGLKQMTDFKKKKKIDQNPYSGRSFVLWAAWAASTRSLEGWAVKGSASPARAVFREKVAVRRGGGRQGCAWDLVSTAGVPALCGGTAQLSAPLDEPGEMSLKPCLDAAAPNHRCWTESSGRSVLSQGVWDTLSF